MPSQFAESGLAVTSWVAALRSGDEVAASRLWNYMEGRLLKLGRRHLVSKTTYDEDDLALSAFHALCDAIQDGRYQELGDRNEIWRVLSTIALNKFRNRVVYESALRRGGAMRRTDLELVLDSQSAGFCGQQKLQMEEECERLCRCSGAEKSNTSRC